MSNTTDKMLDRYVYLYLDYGLDGCGTTISVKLDDEGVVVDAWSDGECVASTWKTYDEMGVEAVAVETLEELRDKASFGNFGRDCLRFMWPILEKLFLGHTILS